MKIKTTPQFEKWLLLQNIKSKIQIKTRISNLKQNNHWGNCKKLSENLSELKWKNGRRIYFTRYEEKGTVILLLLGGHKNAQRKDIQKSLNLIEKYGGKA